MFNSMRQMSIPPGETVGIQGLGGLGHLGLQYASKMGFRVVAISSSGSKEKFAKDLGANDYIDGSKAKPHEALQKLGGAAMILCTAPNPDIIGEMLGGLAPKGKLVVLTGESPLFLSSCSGTADRGLLIVSAAIGDIKVDTTTLVLGGRSVHGWP